MTLTTDDSSNLNDSDKSHDLDDSEDSDQFNIFDDLHIVAQSILNYHRVGFHRDPLLTVRDPTPLEGHRYL